MAKPSDVRNGGEEDVVRDVKHLDHLVQAALNIRAQRPLGVRHGVEIQVAVAKRAARDGIAKNAAWRQGKNAKRRGDASECWPLRLQQWARPHVVTDREASAILYYFLLTRSCRQHMAVANFAFCSLLH